MMVERAFISLAEGQVHLRRYNGAQGSLPLLLLHASPVSSWVFQGLMEVLALENPDRTLIAPDTLGNGDSAPPAPAAPDIAYFAESQLRLLDALGVERVDLYGSHTGARIACEFAAAFPDRVRRVIFDGIIEYDDAMRADIVAHYAPPMKPDVYGGYLAWAFNFVRDQALYFPYFKRDPEHRLAGAMPPPEVLNRAVLDVLKALGTYSKPYIAAFEYRAYERMPLIQAPVMLLKPEAELPILNAAVAKASELLRHPEIVSIGVGEPAKARAMTQFLDRA